LDPCVYEVFDSESTLELNPEVVNLTPGTPVELRGQMAQGPVEVAHLFV